ncbi:MAG: hypothetical protein PGN34_06845 [Methylobacterium frigidaeris]
MRRTRAALCALGLLAGLAAPAAAAETTSPPAARTEKTFLIPSSDGYGVADCLATAGGSCGQVVADAWCESQGFSQAVSFGVAAKDEYTGAIDAPSVPRPAERPVRITCKE